MGYSKDYCKTWLFKYASNVITDLMSMKPGDEKKYEHVSVDEARKFRYRVYDFMQGYMVQSRFRIKVVGTDVVIKFPEV